MKTVLIIATLISGFAFGQTNIIAAKSHSSNQTIDKNDFDNFGGPFICTPARFVMSVEYLKPDCIVEKSQFLSTETETETETEFMFDTICDHPFLKEGSIRVDRLKGMYHEDMEYINFEELNNDEGSVKRKIRNEKHTSKSSIFWLILIGGGLFFIYLFVPKSSLKPS